MKILLIAEKNHYRDWIGKTYSDLLIYFKYNSKHKIDLIYSDENIGTNLINKPDIIVFFDTDVLTCANKFDYLFKLNIPCFASSLDLFYFNNCINCPYINKCDGILHFSYATKLLNSYRDFFPKKKIKAFKGRFINSERFKDYKQEKIYDILIYGSRGDNVSIGFNKLEPHYADQEYKKKWEAHHNKTLSDKWMFYPLRVRLEELLLKNKNKYKLHIVPNACIFNATVANEDLSKLINKTYMTLSCCTRADIAMSKYFEIAASYSAILGNIPSDYEELFKNNIVEITEWMSDEEILYIIDKALSDKQKLQEMVNIIGDKIHKEYNLDAGVKDMDEVFDTLI